jgi:prephenate dehydratase
VEDRAEMALVPIVNSTSTAYQVNETLVGLREYVGEKGIKVRDEEVVPISMNLAAIPGARIEDIRTVSSKDKALQQCSRLKEILGHDYTPIPTTESTAAAAASLAKERSMDKAVVVPRRAADLYGLQILASGVQDNTSNQTRFHVIANRDHAKTGSDATKILFEYNDVGRPGLLYDTLGVINGVNMRYLQLLAIDGSLSQLTFFVDIDGHRQDKGVEKVLEKLRRRDYFKRFDILGSYPTFKEEQSNTNV